MDGGVVALLLTLFAGDRQPAQPADPTPSPATVDRGSGVAALLLWAEPDSLRAIRGIGRA